MIRDKLLGDFSFKELTFEQIDESFKLFKTEEFSTLNERRKREVVGEQLISLIESEKSSFLLPQVLNFVGRVDEEKLLFGEYNFSSFELFLNGHEREEEIRGKIVGKFIPREEYQRLFPLNDGKIFEGSHFVSAHKSADLDTLVASFWGWMDAFAAKVAMQLHLWNVPDGVLKDQIEIKLLFKNVFGDYLFSHLMKTRTNLALSGVDLMERESLSEKGLALTTSKLEYERERNAIIVVDEDGFYVGDFRGVDIEEVKQITFLFESLLLWFENYLQISLIAFFSKGGVSKTSFLQFLETLFNMKLAEGKPFKQCSKRHKEQLDLYLKKVLKMEKGVESSFQDIVVVDIKKLYREALNISGQKFNEKGEFAAELFSFLKYLEKVFGCVQTVWEEGRERLESLHNAVMIKSEVFDRVPHFVTLNADIEEIRTKMGDRGYLTVTFPDKDKYVAAGIIPSVKLQKRVLGTVSLRDFCNLNEVTLAPYLEVISVIDHHKSDISTIDIPLLLLSDVKSTNTLVAEQIFAINDRFTTNGMTLEEIDEQLKENSSAYLLKKLLTRKSVAKGQNAFFISKEREFLEYLHFIYAILDDSDLLMKVSRRDLECVAELLNRLKSLSVGKELEIISLADITQDPDFIKKGSDRILKNKEMHSLYSKVFYYKEEEAAKSIEAGAVGEKTLFFADTKEQNRCCRIGQTKMFLKNIPLFKKRSLLLQRRWLEESKRVFEERKEIDLHLHMISTVRGADEVFKGEYLPYDHLDELWIWLPPKDGAIEHLKSFLNAFSNLSQVQQNAKEVEFLDLQQNELQQIFKESFLPVKFIENDKGLNIAVLRYTAGAINSRKNYITPCLPGAFLRT